MAKEEAIPPGQFFARRWALYAALGVPKIDIEKYRLTVDGLVERELSFSYDELQKLPQVKLVRDFSCVTQWSIKDVVWEGAPFKAIMDMARVKPEADWVMFHCLEGYTAPVRLDDAKVDDSLIALKMNGNPISTEQGFPARPFIPRLYGWKSAKWLNRIEFMQGYEDGYWEMYGYSETANVWKEERFKSAEGKHSRRRGLGTVEA